MTDFDALSRAYDLGHSAGAMDQVHAHECPYSHAQTDERNAWLSGFGAGRAYLVKNRDAPTAVSPEPRKERQRRAVPFGSRCIFHYTTKTIAVTYLGQTTVLGPFDDEDAAHKAASDFIGEQNFSDD